VTCYSRMQCCYRSGFFLLPAGFRLRCSTPILFISRHAVPSLISGHAHGGHDDPSFLRELMASAGHPVFLLQIDLLRYKSAPARTASSRLAPEPFLDSSLSIETRPSLQCAENREFSPTTVTSRHCRRSPSSLHHSPITSQLSIFNRK
jgi:hypothetical protein